jgi:hypothetical protein
LHDQVRHIQWLGVHGPIHIKVHHLAEQMLELTVALPLLKSEPQTQSDSLKHATDVLWRTLSTVMAHPW